MENAATADIYRQPMSNQCHANELVYGCGLTGRIAKRDIVILQFPSFQRRQDGWQGAAKWQEALTGQTKGSVGARLLW